MQDHLSGYDAHLLLKYELDGQPLIPTVGTVSYILFDHDGMFVRNVQVTTDSATFQSNITIPAVDNVIAAGRSFERRSLVAQYTVNGIQYTKRLNYRVIPLPLYTVTPSEVRNFIGVNPKELPDADIDIFTAYLKAREAIGEPLTVSLTLGTLSEIYANEAIKMMAVIEIIPSLQNRVAQSETNGLIGFDRINIKDFSSIRAEAVTRLATAVALITGESGTGATYTLVTVTQDADPVTGG